MRAVMITVTAENAEKAKEFGRTIENFVLNEDAPAIPMPDGTFIIFGDVTGELEDSLTVEDETVFQLPDPDSPVQ